MTPAAITHVPHLSNRVLAELLARAESGERDLRPLRPATEHLDLQSEIDALRLEKNRRLKSLRAPLTAVA